MDTSDLEPLRLSRELEAVSTDIDRIFARTRSEAPTGDPFSGRLFPGKTHYDAVLGMPPMDPLRGPLSLWIHELVRARVQMPWTLEGLRLEYHERHPVSGPRDGSFSRAEVRSLALGSRGEERRVWILTRSALDERTASFHLERWGRLAEIDRRLGAQSDVLSPLGSRAELVRLAHEVLTRTRAALSELGLDELEVSEKLLTGAAEGWPARLRPDSIVDLVRARSWTGGFRLRFTDVPERKSPASFLLALSGFGRAFSRARVRSDLPFVIVHSPLDLRTWTEGALFGLIPLTFPFLKRRLDLSFGRVAGARRALAGAVVSELHRAAQRALLFDAALGSAGAARDLATEFSERALGARESGEALLGRLLRTSRPDRDLVALVEAGVRSVEAQRSYDEDWFDNPRFQEEFIDLGQSVPPLYADKDRLMGEGLAWVDELIGALG
jgi:hypothetical protein